MDSYDRGEIGLSLIRVSSEVLLSVILCAPHEYNLAPLGNCRSKPSETWRESFIIHNNEGNILELFVEMDCTTYRPTFEFLRLSLSAFKDATKKVCVSIMEVLSRLFII